MERDELTGLPTKTKFLEDVAAWRTGAILYVDIDQLRFANAVMGHARTDALLKSMARLIEVVCNGEMVARVSGVQFAVFVREAADARSLAAALCTAFQRAYQAERAEVLAGAQAAGVIQPKGPVLTVSIGLATVADYAGTKEALETATGLAHAAVVAGRDRVVA